VAIQAMLEEHGYSMLHDSIVGFGLLFLENPWVLKHTKLP